MEQINKNLGVIRAEYYKNKRFISAGEFKVPPEFELKGYDEEPSTTPDPSTTTSADDQQQQPQDLIDLKITKAKSPRYNHHKKITMATT